MKIINIACVVGVLICTGCASIVSKSQYPVTIQSNPSGATVVVKNKHGAAIQRATTPATVFLSAKSGFFSPEKYSIEFKKPGCNSCTTALSANLDPWYFGNIIFGGLIGAVIVDPATGAMWKLDKTVIADLSKQTALLNNEAKMAEFSEQIATKLQQFKGLKNAGFEEQQNTLVKNSNTKY